LSSRLLRSQETETVPGPTAAIKEMETTAMGIAATEITATGMGAIQPVRK